MTTMNASDGARPATRTELLVDGVLAAALVAFLMLGTYVALRHQPGHRPFDAGTVVLVVVAAGALAWRRRYPSAVLVVVFGAILAYRVLGYANGPVWLALIVAFVTAVVHGRRLAAAAVAAVAFGVFPWLDYLLRNEPAPSLASLTGLAAWLLVLLGAAQAVRIRRERAAEAVRIREEEALRRSSEERLRIAQELHDALGHHLSLINVQAGVALHLHEELPEPARNSLAAIKNASNEALGELRSVLDILRQEGEQAPRSPTSTLARLDDLVSQTAAGGLQVRTETHGEVRPLPFAVDAAAFRIVQEALTNVTRHAGTARATVRVSYGERDLTVQVDDDGRGTVRDGAVGVGKGIVGMRERVAALGGELQAGPQPGGGFRVRARLPLDSPP